MPELLQGFVILLFSGQKFMPIQSSIGCHMEAISASLDHVPDSQCPDRQIRMFVLKQIGFGNGMTTDSLKCVSKSITDNLSANTCHRM